MRSAFLLIALTCPLASACAPVAPIESTAIRSPQAALEDLLTAERSFVSASEQASGAAPLTGMFAPDVVMMGVPEPGFATTPADAVARISKIIGAANQNGRISWSPVRAGISADGQQGFTVGYLTVSQADKPAFQAKYLSYWVKRPEGWRVKLYKFVQRDIGEIPATTFPSLIPTALVAPGAPNTEAGASLAAAEKAFSDASQTASLREYFKKLGRPDSMHTLADNNLVVGSEAIGEAHPDGPSPLRWKADDVVIASSGDLGATYGYLERNGPTPPGRLAKIPFFTIWYRESPQAPWHYVVE